MPVFVDARNQDAPGGESFPLGLGESIKTGFEESAISGPVFGGLLANQIRVANQSGPVMSQADAKAQAASEGFPELQIPSAGMTAQGLETMLAIARDRAEGEERLSRASGIGSFAGSLAGGFADPVMAGLNFIPVVGGAREAAILAKASVKAGMAGRILARGAIGAVEGAVGAIPSMALNAATRQAVGDDYTADDAFSEFTSSVVLGGAMQAGIGQVGEGVSALADRSSHSWVREKFGTKSQEWRALMEHDKRTADAIAPDHAAPEEPVTVAPEEIGAEGKSIPEAKPRAVEPQQPKARRGWNESPFKRDRLEVSSGLRDALGDRVIVRAARSKTDPLAEEIFEAMKKNEGEIARAPGAIASLANAADAVADARRLGFTLDEALEYKPSFIGSELDKMAARAQNLTFQERDAARALIALEGQPERMARFVGEIHREQQKQDATRAVEAAIALIAAPKGPAEKARIAAPETITNAEAIADFQAKSGIRIDAEKVIDADPRVDQADPDAPAKEIARAGEPEARYDADELRSGRDRAKESEALPDDEDFETLADDAEAELERLRKLTETEGARFAESEVDEDTGLPLNPDGTVTVNSRFSEGSTESDLRIQDAADAIETRFGTGTIEAARKAGFEIVAAKDLPEQAQRANVVGVTVGKKSYLAADRMSREDAAAYFLHEYGVHVGVQSMLGPKAFADLTAKVEDLLTRDPDLQAVVNALVPATTKSIHVAEERLAYLVQHMEGVLAGREEWPTGAAWLRITDPATRRAIVELVREIVAKVKAYLYAEFPAMRGMNLSAEDFHAIAVRSLQHGSEMDRRAMFAETKTADDEIAAAKEMSKRVRGVYKKAYDKIAAAPELSDDQLAIAAQAAGLEKAEAAELVKRFRKAGSAEAALKEDMTTAALIRYRATLNAVKLHEGLAQVMRFKGNEVEGALSLDGGSEWNVEGVRARNVDSARGKWESELCGGPEWELTKAKLYDLAKDPEHSANIVNALYDLQTGTKEGLGVKYNADHAKIAEILNRGQEASLKRLRRMGVDIGQIKGRMLHQEHDTWALRNFANGSRTGATRAGIRGLVAKVLPGKWIPIGTDAHMNAWIDFVAPLLDAETYDGRKVDRAYLEGAYRLLAGFKEPSRERELLSGRYSTGGVPGEAARLSNLGRNMKFKGPDEWAMYQKRCGNPSILENFFGEQQATARSLAILEIYGPGGENTRTALHQAVGQQLIGKPAMDWQNSKRKRDGQWAVVSGKINVPGSEILANVYDNSANLARSAVLGGSILSQAPDAVNIAKWRALRFNKGAAGVYTESAAHLQDFARAASNSPKIRQVLEYCRADLDATMGGLLRKIEIGDSKGFTSNLVEKVYKYQGVEWLNRNNKHASILALSNWLASESRHGFDGIEPTTRDMLAQHNIGAEEWDLIRQAEQIADDGRGYLTPEGLAAVPEAKIAEHLAGTGRKADAKAVDQWRDDTRIKIIGMMTDEASKAMIEPTARQQLTATGGIAKGTWSGSLVRAMWMCKSFAISQFQRGWMTEINGRSRDPRARVRAGSGSHYLAIANYITALTGMGFLSYILKGWATGVQRKGIFESGDEDDKVLFFDLPVFDDRVLFAAMNQGGGLGIYGDFLFADADRYGGGFMQTLSGPLLGKVEDAYKLWNAAKGADEEDAGKLANQAVRMLKGATPFGNLWWSRHIMDRLLWWNLQEAINPAGLQRLEAAAQKRGDTYIFTKPTAALN